MELPQSTEVVFERTKRLLEEEMPHHLEGTIVDNLVILDIASEEVHYWSPQLTFRIEPDELQPDGTVISGLIGPRPAVWTMFMFIYFGIGVIGFFLSSLGVAKWNLGEYSNWLLAFPISILLMLSAYMTSKHGEKLAAEQTQVLKEFVRKIVYNHPEEFIS